MSNLTNPTWPAGYVINERTSMPDPEMLAAYRGKPAAYISDCLGRSIGTIGLRAFHGNALMCGPALTVKVRPGDNLMIHKAILMAQPGDVLVVDGGGDLTQALMGGNMRASMIVRKMAGVVVNGAIRDVAEWEEPGLPIYALGSTHRGPSKDGPGEINVSVSCAGLLVGPGDLVIGDSDGVVAIPANQLRELLPLVEAQVVKEQNLRASILSGKIDAERFDSMLRKKGCPV